MAEKMIRVGLIGATPDQGWAMHTHVPALKTLPGLELVAVGTSRPESAKLSARTFNVEHAFSSATELAAHPDVDLVAISTSVGTHDSVIRDVLPSGKPIFCEWPLGSTTAEATALAEVLSKHNVYNAIGLQARVTPPLVHARNLITEGKIGRLLSLSIYSSLPYGAGGVYPPSFRNNMDPDYGATLLAIAAGHIVDAVEWLGGGLESVGARVKTVQKTSRYLGTFDDFDVLTPDNIVLYGTLKDGGAFNVHISSGKNNGSRTVVEVSGSGGDLRLESDGPGLQVSQLRLTGAFGLFSALRPLPIPPDLNKAGIGVTETGTNVAELYARIAADIHRGSRTMPDFSHAARLHRIVDKLRESTQKNGVETVLNV